jgi:hypothetical protein
LSTVADKMKNLRFSLASVLALLVIVATVLSVRQGLTSESALQAVWLASFILSYWRSSTRGWRQVVRVTAVTSVMWGVTILCVYRWCMDRVGAPDEGLVRHGILIALVGSLFTFTLALLVEGVRVARHSWRAVTRRRSVITVSLLLFLTLLLGTAWKITQPRVWRPVSIVDPDEAARREFGTFARVVQRPELEYAQSVTSSADGQLFAARLNGSAKVLVFAEETGEAIASLDARPGEWFVSLSFHPDGSALTTILRSRSAKPRVVQWCTDGWEECTHPLLEDLLGQLSHSDMTTSLSVHHQFLVVANLRRVGQAKARVEIVCVDLLEEQLAPHNLGSVMVELSDIAPRVNDEFFPDRISWMCSPSGKCVATASVLFRANAPPTSLPGSVLGFLPDRDQLIVYERSERLVWKRRRRSTVAPPFWDYLRHKTHDRVAIIDCGDLRATAQSPWLEFGNPRMSPDESQLLAEVWRGSALVWDFPDGMTD